MRMVAPRPTTLMMQSATEQVATTSGAQAATKVVVLPLLFEVVIRVPQIFLKFLNSAELFKPHGEAHEKFDTKVMNLQRLVQNLPGYFKSHRHESDLAP